MENIERAILEDILVAEVLNLAKETKANKSTTSDGIAESISLIRQKRADILRRLAETR